VSGIKRDEADRWFSKVVRLRVNWRCEHCQKQYDESSTGLHCAHIYGRANKAVRWDLDNAVSLCYACHQKFGANPLDFHAWLHIEHGPGHMELLNEKRRAIFKTTAQMRKEIAAHYRQEYRRMTETGDRTPINY